MARIDEQDLDEQRLIRRQKRKKAELTAYIILVIICVLIFAGAAFFIHFISGKIKDKRAVQQTEVVSETEVTEEESAVIETPEESQEAIEYSEEDILSEIIDGVLADEPLEDKVAGLFIVTPEQLTGVDTAVKAGAGTQEALATYAVGGITYYPKNIKSADQIKEMLDATTSMSKYPLFTVLSEQAAYADGVKEILGYGAESDITDEESAGAAAKEMGSELFKNGFNFCIAPSTELQSGTEAGAEGEEGEAAKDNDAVKDIAYAFSKGLTESGISSCPYVFPMKGDTLSGPSSDDISKDDLVVGRYEIFKHLIDEGVCNAIMVSNISLPQVTGNDTPASLSDIMITDELRGTLGFDGIVITSPLNEGAVTENYSAAEAAEAAIKAGADMLYVPDDFTAAYEGLLESISAGHITEERIDESLRRIYRIKYAAQADQIAGSN
jgi:beta-N-acetylhexosaminidase